MVCAHTKHQQLQSDSLQLAPIACMFECECTLETFHRRQLAPRKTGFAVAFVRDDKASERLHMKQIFAAAANKIDFITSIRSKVFMHGLFTLLAVLFSRRF